MASAPVAGGVAVPPGIVRRRPVGSGQRSVSPNHGKNREGGVSPSAQAREKRTLPARLGRRWPGPASVLTGGESRRPPPRRCLLRGSGARTSAEREPERQIGTGGGGKAPLAGGRVEAGGRIAAGGRRAVRRRRRRRHRRRQRYKEGEANATAMACRPPRQADVSVGEGGVAPAIWPRPTMRGGWPTHGRAPATVEAPRAPPAPRRGEDQRPQAPRRGARPAAGPRAARAASRQ